jgi:hypothetical protein
MKITKRRVTKRNRIKRKYSKKRTKTRHSRKRVFSKKRRKTIKKKKRGGMGLDYFKDKYDSYKKNKQQQQIEKQEKKKKEDKEKKNQLFTEHYNILENDSWKNNDDNRFQLYSEYDNKIINPIKNEAQMKQKEHFIESMQNSNSQINRLRANIISNKSTNEINDKKEIEKEKRKLYTNLTYIIGT